MGAVLFESLDTITAQRSLSKPAALRGPVTTSVDLASDGGFYLTY